MSNLEPGWYDDGSGTQRWWDGGAWTEHVGQPAVTMRAPKLRRPLILAVAAVAVTAALVATLVVTLGGGSGKGDSPSVVVNKWLNATTCSQVEALESPSMWAKKGPGCTDGRIAEQRQLLANTKIMSTSISGDSATVDVKLSAVITGATVSATAIMYLVKIDGDWKIDHVTKEI